MSSPADSGKIARPENVLYRSRIEIGYILQTLADEGCTLSTEIADGRQFAARLLAVNQTGGYFVIAHCADKYLNSLLFRQLALEFIADLQGAHIAFQVSNPADTVFDGQPAIRFALPQSLILYHRRERPQVAVATAASLRCIADAGGILPFEARIIDISLDGKGSMLYAEDINVEAGSILKDSRIFAPSGKTVIADLEVCSTTSETLADGSPANRAELRFIRMPDEFESLSGIFVQNLDAPLPRRQ